jgi:hypothetical protein
MSAASSKGASVARGGLSVRKAKPVAPSKGRGFEWYDREIKKLDAMIGSLQRRRQLLVDERNSQ